MMGNAGGMGAAIMHGAVRGAVDVALSQAISAVSERGSDNDRM